MSAADPGLRLVASEIGMVLRRRRNQLMLLLLAAIPVIIGVAVKLTTNGQAGGLIGNITDNESRAARQRRFDLLA